MNTLLGRFHNFILRLVRGEDNVCGCTCGRNQVYHVVPYYGAESMVDSRENYFLSNILTQQEMDVITGLLLGLCISWFLLWLDGVWHSGRKYQRANQQNNVGFLSWMAKITNRKDSMLHQKNTEDSMENKVHIKQDVCHKVKGST